MPTGHITGNPSCSRLPLSSAPVQLLLWQPALHELWLASQKYPPHSTSTSAWALLTSLGEPIACMCPHMHHQKCKTSEGESLNNQNWDPVSEWFSLHTQVGCKAVYSASWGLVTMDLAALSKLSNISKKTHPHLPSCSFCAFLPSCSLTLSLVIEYIPSAPGSLSAEPRIGHSKRGICHGSYRNRIWVRSEREENKQEMKFCYERWKEILEKRNKVKLKYLSRNILITLSSDNTLKSQSSYSEVSSIVNLFYWKALEKQNSLESWGNGSPPKRLLFAFITVLLPAILRALCHSNSKWVDQCLSPEINEATMW